MKRKLIASLLCLCMLVSLLPVAAFAGNTEATEPTTPAKPTIALAGFNADGYVVDDTFFNKLVEIRGSTYTKPTGDKLDSEKNTLYLIINNIDKNGKYVVTLCDDTQNAEEKTIYTSGETAYSYTSLGLRIAFATAGDGAALPEGVAIPSEGNKSVTYTYKVYAVKATEGTKAVTEAEGAALAQASVTVTQVTLDAGEGTFAERTGYKDTNKDGVVIAENKKTATVNVVLGEDGTPVADLGIANPTRDGYVFKGWDAEKVTSTKTALTAQWEKGATTELQAGFSWKAADADKGLNDAFAKIGVTPAKAISDSLDQTVWVLAQRPAATDSEEEKAAAPAYYWYTVENTTGTTKTTYFQGPITIAAEKQAAGSYVSFLHFGDNTNNVAPADGKLTVKLYALAADPGQAQPPTLPQNPTSTVQIDAGANPDKISAVTPDVSAGTVKVDFNSKMSGRYYIELVKDGTQTPVKTIETDCDRGATPDGSFTTKTFDGVTFAAGKYIVNVYPRLGGEQGATGKVGTTPIDSKEFTLDGTINSVDVYVGSSETPSTAITAKLNAAKTGIEVSGSLVNKEANMTIKLVARTAAGDVEVTDIAITDGSGNLKNTTDKKLTVLGTEYPITLALTAIETPVVDTGVSADVSKIAEADRATVKASAESVKTTTDLSDMATAAAAKVDAAKDADPQYEAKAIAQLKSAGVTVSDDNDVSIVVQPYLDVTAESYDATKGQLKIDVTAMTRVVATTDDGTDIKLENSSDSATDKNAVVIGTPEKMDVKTSIVIQITLPINFAAKDTKILVQHNDAHYHQGTVGDANLLTFTSTDGLSPFMIDKTATVAARIGDEATGTYYKTLGEAVEAVEDGGTIVLLKSGEEATVNRTVKFKIDGGKNNYTATLKDASGKVVEAGEDGFYSFTQSGGGNTSGGSGGGGGVSSNVTIDRPTNGKVSVSPTAPSKGATVTITLTPDTGYVVGSVTVTDKDGKAVELTKVSDTKYTFTMPDGKVKVAATFTKAGAEGFTDVPADAYYADAVKWAVEKGITNGLTATTFGPNNSCTRGQMVTFLWRAAGSPAATGTNSFSDVASGEYYYNAVLWAVEKGITNGTSATTFSPNATVNRGQTVTFLYRYAESPAATGESSFTDVAADAFYADAVKWAVAEEITNGTSSTTFSPASNCTRGQIVTFMYRQMAE